MKIFTGIAIAGLLAFVSIATITPAKQTTEQGERPRVQQAGMFYWQSSPFGPRIATGKLRKGETRLLRVIAPVNATAFPGGGRVIYRIPTQVPYGLDQMQLRVLREQAGPVDPITGVRKTLYLVHIPYRPNGLKGWVTSDKVQPIVTPWHVTIKLSTRTVTLKKSGRVVKRWKTVIGRPSTPTPRGSFAIHGKSDRNHPFNGTGVLAFAYSNVIKQFDGGPGRVAMHGRAGASLRDPLGSARSTGCPRMDNAAIDYMLARLPIGTPVIVIK